MTADIVIFAHIYTCKSPDDWALAAAIRDGKFVFVGDAAQAGEWIGDSTSVLHWENRWILPGFIDGHTHACGGKTAQLYRAYLLDDDSVEAYLARLQAYIAQHPDEEVYSGMGWSNGVFDNKSPHAELLDRIEPNKPVILLSSDWHAYWLNSAALRAAHITSQTPNPMGGRVEKDKEGRPTGCLRETAMAYAANLYPKRSIEHYKHAICQAQEMFLAFGVTAFMDIALNLDGSLDVFEAYRQLESEGRLKMHVFGGYLIDATANPAAEIRRAAELMNLTRGHRFQLTDIKVFVDGVVEGGTGFLSQPLANAPHDRGENRWADNAAFQNLKDIIVLANRAGLSVHFHTIGDAAVSVALDAIQCAQNETGLTHVRNALTHLQMVSKEQLQQIKALNVMAVVNPYWFFKEKGYFHEVEVHYLGSQRAHNQYPLRDIYDADIRVAMASDYPITPDPQPLKGIQIGVTRMNLDGDQESLHNPQQRVCVEQLVDAATLSAAYQLKAENTIGSIECEKSADFIVLDKNILTLPPNEIASTRICKTFIDGHCVFDAD